MLNGEIDKSADEGEMRNGTQKEIEIWEKCPLEKERAGREESARESKNQKGREKLCQQIRANDKDENGQDLSDITEENENDEN